MMEMLSKQTANIKLFSCVTTTKLLVLLALFFTLYKMACEFHFLSSLNNGFRNNLRTSTSNVFSYSSFLDGGWAPSRSDPTWERLGKHKHALQLIHTTGRSLEEMKDLPKILCWVNTFDKNHETRAKAIKRTWGKLCDKLVFFSNKDDPSLPSIAIDAPATHEDLWKKHRLTIEYVNKHYGDDYEWFFKADDDTYAFVDNLKEYIASPEVAEYSREEPLLLGHRMTLQSFGFNMMLRGGRKHKKTVSDELKASYSEYMRSYPHNLLHYSPGGGGYIMNRSFLRMIASTFHLPRCFPTDAVPDDAAIAYCMKYYHNVVVKDTRDVRLRERFHQYSPKRVYFEKTTGPESFWWNSDHISIGWKNGTDCCSTKSISFHYVTPQHMDIIHDLFYPNFGDNVGRSD